MTTEDNIDKLMKLAHDKTAHPSIRHNLLEVQHGNTAYTEALERIVLDLVDTATRLKAQLRLRDF